MYENSVVHEIFLKTNNITLQQLSFHGAVIVCNALLEVSVERTMIYISINATCDSRFIQTRIIK